MRRRNSVFPDLSKRVPPGLVRTSGVGAERAVAEDGGILPDRIGLLPQRRPRSRKNPFPRPARERRAGTGKA